ncbi:D-alanyl-D-alanine carboxypeptidase family protein [Aquihabitans sp. McL0605]|uniref:D-alanyl-D-alanine carboxypeptidase family protein n=1 Tax=Aquihabitans sp. McL0605 TaxID=3415671 RepID=UPI003CEA1BB8
MTIGLVAPEVASSAPKDDPRAEREQVRAEQAKVASELDTTKATQAQVDQALQVINENLQTQEAALNRTEAQVAQAEQDVADAEAAITKLKGEIKTLRAEIRRRAVRAYVSPVGDDVLSVLDTNDFVTASSRKFYIELRSQDDADVADRLNGALSEIDYQRQKAETARKVAVKKRAEQAKRTDAVRTAKAQKQKIANKLQATVNSQIARSIELGKTDRALSKKIAEQQAALVARLAAEAAAAQAAQAAQAARQTAATTNQGPSGSETGPLPPISTGGGSGTGTGGISLCTVGGITVNCAIQSQLGAMLNAARADGVGLSGGGYRDPSSQIRLRQAHCGSSYYAIYEMSASSCHPPTARPGTSQHEIGLAIDFDNCSYRSSACYQWLAGHASSFGFYNLPSEAWHWSTTGS